MTVWRCDTTFAWRSCSQCANKKEQSLSLDVAATSIAELLPILKRRTRTVVAQRKWKKKLSVKTVNRVWVWTVKQNLAAAGMTLWTVSKSWQLQKQQSCCVQTKWSTNIMVQRTAEMWLGWLHLLSIKWVSVWEMFLKVNWLCEQ